VDAARDRLAAAGCSVLIVAQAGPELIARYVARYGWLVPIVADPDRDAYGAFGLERTSWLTFLRPRVIWGYLRGMLRGYGVKRPNREEDILQLGGDFILDREARVVFAYPSADPTDRPTISAILDALAAARRS
jgi:hypothetical protein